MFKTHIHLHIWMHESIIKHVDHNVLFYYQMAIDSIPFNRNCIAARVALAVYLSGFLCFLIGLATPNWLHVDQGMQGGLWSACYYVQDVGWTCNQYKSQPGLTSHSLTYICFIKLHRTIKWFHLYHVYICSMIANTITTHHS